MGSMSLANNPWMETPLVESKPLSRAAGCRIFLKLENLQPGASFKIRGIGNYMLAQIQSSLKSNEPSDLRPFHFYSSSEGNAGLACVTAANMLGCRSSVVLPTSTEEAMILRLKAAGANEVISYGNSWAFADEHLRESVIPDAVAKGEKAVYVPPFNHPLVWQGHSTMIDEIRLQLPDEGHPDAIVCSVGGGGLFAGIMQGVDRQGWDQTQVLAMETVGADSLAQSLRRKELTTLDGITSIARSLGAVRVAEQAYKQALRPNVTNLVLEDAEATMGSWRFADDERMLVEPACGVSIALAYDGRLKKHIKNFGPESKVILVICGGCRVSLADLASWKEKFGARAEELGVLGREQNSVPSSVAP